MSRFFVGAGGAVFEMDVPAAGFARERHLERVARRELVEVDEADVERVQVAEDRVPALEGGFDIVATWQWQLRPGVHVETAEQIKPHHVEAYAPVVPAKY